MSKYAVCVSTFIVVFLGYVATGVCGDLNLTGIRPPAFAGQFYPSDPEKLEMTIHQFLRESTPLPMEDPVALLVPHAGYIYSGQICADAYRQIMNRNYDVFIILGVNHTTGGFRGISLADYQSFRSPLGDVQIDENVTEEFLSECSDCVLDKSVHIREHSIEAQIPFIQVLFPKAKIVPIIIHPPDPDLCARFGKILAGVLKNKKALIIISTDLSHYPNAADSLKADHKTLKTIAGLDPKKVISIMRDLNSPNLDTRACGEAAILTGITAARILGARRTIIAGYSNSGDVATGDRQRVVGYGALAITPGDAPNNISALNRPRPPVAAVPLKDSEKKTLLTLARQTIHQFLTTQTVPLARNLPPRFHFRQGAFVTLKYEGLLRGCIGNILPENELGKTVGKVSWLAAFKDPRFHPVELKELDNIEIEISVLTPMESITDPDQIVVGRDGVLLTKEGNSAVFLPQVAPENNWDRAEMLENLCTKARLPEGCWKKQAKFQIFQAEVFSEHGSSGQ